MRFRPLFRAAASACLAFVALAAPAFAEPILVAGIPYGDPRIEPNAPTACAPHAQDYTVPGLWLGHFTGGRLVKTAGYQPDLEWKDLYSCFPTRASCQRWLRDSHRVFSGVDGWKTCVALRGGGTRFRVVHHRETVIAKY